MSDEIKLDLAAAIEWITSESAHCGAGMGDCPSDEECAAAIKKALGFTREDVELLERLQPYQTPLEKALDNEWGAGRHRNTHDARDGCPVRQPRPKNQKPAASC